MRKITYLLLLIPCYFSALSQELMINNFKVSVEQTRNYFSEENRMKYEGSPFLWETWQEGSAIFKGGDEKNYILQYFIPENTFYFKTADTIYSFNLQGNISQVVIGERIFIKTFFEVQKKYKLGMLELISDGKIRLLKLFDSSLKKGTDESGYKTEQKPHFITKEYLYFQKEGKEAKLLPMKKKEFFDLFGENSKEIEQYFKENKLKMKQEDIYSFFKYYNHNY